MLDRPSAPEATLNGSPQRLSPRWPLVLLGAAGLLGACGVAVGAAGAHLDAAAGAAGGRGADLVRTSSSFLMIHAVGIVAGCGTALALGRPPALMAVGLGLLLVGSVLFGGDLALLGLLDRHPVPLAAPAGGLCLIAGWLCLSVSAVALAVRPR